jgi:hypothetical protein
MARGKKHRTASRWHRRARDRADVLSFTQGVRWVAGAGELEAEASGLGVEAGEACAERHRLGKILSPERRRCVVSRARRRGCAHPSHRDPGQPVWSLWLSLDHGAAQADRLASWQGPGGTYLQPTDKDLSVGTPYLVVKGKVPQKQKPRGRLWLNDGSCVWLRPERPNHVWSYDFVSGTPHDGRTVRMLNLIDEHTRESLLVRPERRWQRQGDRSSG